MAETLSLFDQTPSAPPRTVKIGSQHDMILKHLQAGGSLTVAEALTGLGVYALSQRIGELKEMGYSIKSRTIKSNGKRFSRYFIENKAHTEESWIGR